MRQSAARSARAAQNSSCRKPNCGQRLKISPDARRPPPAVLCPLSSALCPPTLTACQQPTQTGIPAGGAYRRATGKNHPHHLGNLRPRLYLRLVPQTATREKSARVSLGKGGPLRLLIIGATGGTGRQLVEQALAQGHEVTALVRDPARLPVADQKLRVLKGDVLDCATLEPAMHGQDAVLCALGHKRFLGPSTILSQGTANILRAMENAGVARFICETSLAIGNTAGRGGLVATFIVYPLILPFYMWDKLRQEKLIEESDLDWVIVRPAALTNGAARGRFRHGPNVGSYVLPVRISRADVAAFMLRQLTDDAYLGSATGLCY